jgi:hypothetical protein
VQHVQQVGRAELGRSTGRRDLLRQSDKFGFLAAGDLCHGRPIGDSSWIVS